MPLPNLIHPVSVTIERADKANSVYDRDLREPIRSVKRSTVTVQAQVSYGTGGKGGIGNPTFEPMGFNEILRGYLLFRTYDLQTLGYSPSRGDRVIKIGHRDTELYMLQIEDMGHYPDQNGSSLVRAFLTDRRPSATDPAM